MRQTQEQVDKKRKLLEEKLKERVLIFDGGAGSHFMSLGLSEEDYRGSAFSGHGKNLKGDHDVLNVTRPDVVAALHAAYVDAGADIIETNTFASTLVGQREYGLDEAQVRELNVSGARVAVEVARRAARPVFVAGSVGPTGKSASLAPSRATFAELEAAYRGQIAALVDGGVDIVLIETVFDTINAKAAIAAAQAVFSTPGFPTLPVWISVTLSDKSGRTLSGQTPDAFWRSVEHARPALFGFNCSLGIEQMRQHVAAASRYVTCPLAIYPNAGIPDGLGKFGDTPDVMARHAADMARCGLVNVVGGCCGTGPAHIRAIAQAIAATAARPRVPPEPDGILRVCGLEATEVSRAANFVNIGESCSVSGSRMFLNRVKDGKFEEAARIARAQVEAGAQLVDVNMDDGMLDSRAVMERFVAVCASDPAVARAPFVVDSSDLATIEVGLSCLQGKSVVNSISLKEGEEKFLSAARLCRKFGAAIIVMAFDEDGQAVAVDHKVRVCERAYRLLVDRLGVPPQDIIFDLNVLTIASGVEAHNAYAVNFIEATRAVKAKFPLAHVSGGVSNLSFAFRSCNPVRQAMHAVFLYHAIAAGMDMALVNAAKIQPYESIPADLRELAEDAVLNRRPDATERLSEYAKKVGDQQGDAPAQAPALEAQRWAAMTPQERLGLRIVEGRTDGLECDLQEAAHGDADAAVAVIEGPLMSGMSSVGSLFSSGKMFLPQVLRSARVMREAVDILKPLLEVRAQKAAAAGGGNGGRTVVLATVKGDVHDIGKNIAAIVLSCAVGARVIDLGTMCPCERIADAAVKEGARIVGISGLITPSLDEMAAVAREFERRGLRIPLLVGGAATSAIHTAVKLAPAYPHGLVVHVPDASRSVPVVAALLSESADTRQAFADEVQAEQERLRKQHQQATASKAARILPLAEARALAPAVAPGAKRAPPPRLPGVHEIDDYPLQRLADHVDWRMFFKMYGIGGTYPNALFPRVLGDERVGPEARKLYDEARAMLAEIVSGKLLRARGVFGIFPARAHGEDIVVFADESRGTRLATFHGLRQQTAPVEEGGRCLALGDLVDDHVAVFAVSTGFGLSDLIERFRSRSRCDAQIMAEALAMRLAEAFSECLHEDVLKHYWQLGEEPGITSVRPAFGFPHQPDHSEKAVAWKLLDVERRTGITLTESWMMNPVTSCSGLIAVSPRAKYFTLGPINTDQVEDYARRKGIPIEQANKLLSASHVDPLSAELSEFVVL